MTTELQLAYIASTEPFVKYGGAIGQRESAMRPWRVFCEIGSACNLSCPSCTKGNKEGYEHENGFMDFDLMRKCLDKIKSENPEAIIFLYGNSEPWLHPRLPECIAEVKARGLRCEMSTNLNFLRRTDEVLAAKPDFIIVSLSGFTQPIYVRGHHGGNIEKVKANMKIVGELNKEFKVPMFVNYHIYTDNEHELEPMRAYAGECGIGLFTSTARAISMENTIQWLREKDGSSYEVQAGQPDWNAMFPPPSAQWRYTMARLKIPPDKAVGMYSSIPVHDVCPVGAGGMFVFIRHDGKCQMCSCTADRRITLGNYLDLTPDQMIEKRQGHPICKLCIKNRLNLYYMIADREKWD